MHDPNTQFLLLFLTSGISIKDKLNVQLKFTKNYHTLTDLSTVAYADSKTWHRPVVLQGEGDKGDASHQWRKVGMALIVI